MILVFWMWSFKPIFSLSSFTSIKRLLSSSLHSAIRVVSSAYGNPLQYSCLENPMDGGAWWAAVHGVVKSRALLSDFTFTFHFHALEKEMATHSSILAWRIPGMEEPSGLLSMGSHRVGHDWNNLACIGEGDGNPLQYSCLENPRDGGAWWAAISGVAQSWTWLQWLSSSSSHDFHFLNVEF